MHTKTLSNFWLRRALVPMALATLAVSAPAAFAYETQSGSCSKRYWTSDVTFKMGPVSFASDFTRAGVKDPGLRINTVGGQWMDLTFVTDTYVGLENGENEIWKSDLSGMNASGWTDITLKANSCEIDEADILFHDGESWAHGIPGDYGREYWDALGKESGLRYMRPLALHELLHAVGLKHEDDDYSMMNYYDRAWSNRYRTKMVEPQPDDRRGLRFLYPNSSYEHDLAVLNTWIDTGDIFEERSVASQRVICKPAKGTGWSSSVFSEFCATSPTTTACPGEYIRTRYTIANYGTLSTNVYERLYLSTDPVLSNNDYESPDVWDRHVVNVIRSGRSYRIPAGTPAGDYWPIVHVEGFTLNEAGESTQNNAIPLTGKITVVPCRAK